VPPDLDQLCLDLLQLDPGQRPTGDEILRRLGGDPAAITNQALSGSVFVGRSQELEALAGHFEQARLGKSVAVFVEGESGIGKSELARQFAELVAGRAIVLSGKCHEREAVPYKAFDEIVDALSDYLLEPAVDVESVVPRDGSLLAKVFPVVALRVRLQ
jgi:hypothetical protein